MSGRHVLRTLSLLAIMLAGTVLAWRIAFRPRPAPLTIQVLARQFEWHFRYPGPDGRFATEDDVVTKNELAVPRRAPVTFVLRSGDVIHGFWIARERLKSDVLPGRTVTVMLAAEEAGAGEVVCAERCGVGHESMRAGFVVLEPADFAAWLDERRRDQGAHDPAAHPDWRRWPTLE